MRVGVVGLVLGLILTLTAGPSPAQTPTPATPAPSAPTTPPATTPPVTAPPATAPTVTAPAPAAPPTPAQLENPPAARAAAAVAGRVLTVDDAIAIALENQPQILQQLKNYAAARYRVQEAFAPLLPQLTGSVTVTRSQTTFLSTSPATGVTIPVQLQRNFDQTFQAQVTLSQEIFDFGKNFASIEAARKLADVALENVELQRQLITLAVKQAYTNILFARRLIAVARQEGERADLNLKSARGFFEVGTQPRSVVTRAEVDVANARVDLIRANNAEQVARVALATAMGLSASTPLQIVDNLAYQPVALDATEVLAEAIRQRPEYKQAKFQAESAAATLKRTFRDFFPDVVASGAYGGIRTSLDPAWSLGLAFTWTMYDGGNRINRYREARANLEAAEANVRATELSIEKDVEQSRLSVVEADERIQAAQAAVASAQENFRLAQGRFDAGVGTILELTDAQLALTQAQNTEAQALADYRNALAQLDRSVGRR